MKTRREFFRSAAAIGVMGATQLPLGAAEERGGLVATGNEREYWVSTLQRIARPVLANLAPRELKTKMPVEEKPGSNRGAFTRLEAFGRLMCGIAPWLALESLSGGERNLQHEFILLARTSLDSATDPASPDFMNFGNGSQALVDSAFLAQGILRAPRILLETLEPRVKGQVIAALKSSRKIKTPTSNNWVMFAATVEAALLECGETPVQERLESCVTRMLGWYLGDGVYGDGEFFHFDYYNSFVIQPMLLDVLQTLAKHDARFSDAHAKVLERAQRFAEIQERLIAPDGTFPSIGRSTTYRFGAFQVLAQVSLLRVLPESIKPAQVRCALSAVIRRMMEAPGTFDAEGWLQIGFCGHQPALGETYISTGSLYLCSAGLLPLGLPATDEFWTAPAAKWTQPKMWSGEDLPADHAITDFRDVPLPAMKRDK